MTEDQGQELFEGFTDSTMPILMVFLGRQTMAPCDTEYCLALVHENDDNQVESIEAAWIAK